MNQHFDKTDPSFALRATEGEDWETEEAMPVKERVSVTIHAPGGVLLAVMFEGDETVSLAVDDEHLAAANRALGLAGACVDFVARASFAHSSFADPLRRTEATEHKEVAR